MKQENPGARYFVFYPHVRLVRGKVGAAVHDLFGGSLYWFRNASAAGALSSVALGSSVSEAAQAAELSEQKVTEYLEVLSGLGLGVIVNEKTAVEPYRPGVLGYQAKKNMLTRTGGTLSVEGAGRCVYDCEFCVSRNPGTLDACCCGVWPAERDRLPEQQLLRAVEQLCWTGMDRLVIRGGEPMLEKERLWLLVEAASRLGMRCEVHSTGILIDQSTARRLRDQAVELVLLTPESEPDAFETAVRRPGAFARFQEGIDCLRAARVPFSAKVAASPPTAARACRTAEWAIKTGATSVQFLWYAPREWNPIRFQQAMGAKTPAEMGVHMKEFIRNAHAHSCFDHSCFISLDGLVSPCIGARRAVANLHETDMGTVLREKRLDAFETTARKCVGPCRACEFRFACTGCLVRTWQLNSSTDSVHARCNYFPDTGEWRKWG